MRKYRPKQKRYYFTPFVLNLKRYIQYHENPDNSQNAIIHMCLLRNYSLPWAASSFAIFCIPSECKVSRVCHPVLVSQPSSS